MKNYVKLSVLSWLLMGLAVALPANEKLTTAGGGEPNELMASIYSDCLKKDSLTCIKYKVFSYIDRFLNQKDDISLSEGITVVKTSNIEEGSPR